MPHISLCRFIRLATYGRGIWELSQLELVSVGLSDDVASCDRDGVLDNGETGRLRITLSNQGPANVDHITLTLASSNPHVTFPQGRMLEFPPIPKGAQRSGSIQVTLSGAIGIEETTFRIAIDAREDALPAPFNVESTHRLNYDERLQGTATETFESANSGWTTSGGATTSPNIAAWQRRALSPTQHVFWGPDNNGQADGARADLPDEQSLISPAMHVGNDPFVISFQHRFSFESGGWDGGVIELSADGGATWTDIGTAAYNGSTNGVTSAPIGASRLAFVGRMVGWPAFANVTLDLGNAFAGKDVKIRFRIGADESTGAPGWDIDDVTVSGLTNTPFTALVPETMACRAH